MSENDLARGVRDVIRDVYGVATGPIPLHAPVFEGNEKAYVLDTIDSTFVSSVGSYVGQFERALCEITSAAHAVATVNGTTALQMSLVLAGVCAGDLVITQSLSFVATANAVAHIGAAVAFVDVDPTTLSLSPRALRAFLEIECVTRAGETRHRASDRRVAACMPMHTFGHPCDLGGLLAVCEEWDIPLVEDAAEALGSYYHGRHCGGVGRLGALSFNGNKIVTTGGGGAILTNDQDIARRAKHLTTTAKIPDRWRYIHDEVGYNFRMPNINAALGCAQLERLDAFVAFKRDLADSYRRRFLEMDVQFASEPDGTRSNYWLCAILLSGEKERDAVLQATNDDGVMTRPVWDPLHTLPMYRGAPRGLLSVTAEIATRLVNIPSGFRAAQAAGKARGR